MVCQLLQTPWEQGPECLRLSDSHRTCVRLIVFWGIVVVLYSTTVHGRITVHPKSCVRVPGVDKWDEALQYAQVKTPEPS
jgi:hypothetical protein